MTNARKALAVVVGTLVAATGAMAADDTTDAPANPYQGVVDRNVFALKPPPPPPDPESTAPPMPNFFLTGITTLPTTRAMFKTTPKPGKGADPAAKEESYMLSEGQRQGEVEVNHIDPVAKMVTVTYAGTVVTLDFTNNAAKLVPVGAPPPPGNGMVRGGPPGLAAHGAPAGRGGLRQPAGPGNTSRPIRSGGGLGVSGGGLGVSGGQPAVGAAPAAANQVAEEPPINVTREQQALLMEAQREMQQDNPAIPPLPPTSLTPLIEAERGGAAPGGPPMPMPTGPARPF